MTWRIKLSPVEKVAGRLFRDVQHEQLVRLNDADPPTYFVPSHIAVFRHECPVRNGVSWALELKEAYEPSPAYQVSSWGNDELRACVLPDPLPEAFELLPGASMVPIGLFAFLWKQGRCSCGITARSDSGRIVVAEERQPLTGRMSR